MCYLLLVLYTLCFKSFRGQVKTAIKLFYLKQKIGTKIIPIHGSLACNLTEKISNTYLHFLKRNLYLSQLEIKQENVYSTLQNII